MLHNIDPYIEKWYSGGGEIFLFGDILKEINNKIISHEIHVGSDSDPSGKKYSFVTGVAILSVGKGSRYFWTRKYINSYKFPTLRSRLELETYNSICVAEKIRESLDINKIYLHLDISTNPQHKSQKYLKILKNYAASMGFAVKVKPDSWAASSIADRHTK